ncbi:methyltransferase-like 26 [Prorops nasuta]|uniref:methyltransferase-like 26 n=1 Tax=Prorops nasuta TaxID=863751 RepID=UPI0034CD618F
MNVVHCAASHRASTVASRALIYPAADRNKDPILSVLRQYINPASNQTLLEIASGSGQHVAHFAKNFPQITFYPSEYESRLLDSIAAHVHGLANVREPLKIDITTDYTTWTNGCFKANSFDYVYNANMMHISHYECTIGLFKNVGKLLKQNGILFTYGPYAINGTISPESNINFHKSLKSQDASWGLRDVADLQKLAKENNIDMIKMFDMPANNKTIIWKKY